MRPAEVDLNLLTVFHAVYDSLHVTRAAEALGISQPALSHSLKRLRETLGDPLFVKTGRGMAPTPLAQELAPTVAAVLEVVEQRLLERRPFVPASLARTFAIATTDFVESLLAPGLLTYFAEHAPNARVAMTPVPLAVPAAALESGACDLAIAGFFGPLPPSFHRQVLFRDTFVSAVRKDHPRARALDGLDAFCNERHLLVAPSGELTGAVDRALAARGKKRDVAAGTSGFMVAGWMTAESDCVLTAPSKLIAVLGRHLPLRVFAPPLELEPIEIVSVWHARMDADPAHRWLRAATASVVARGRTGPKGQTRSR